MTLIPRPTFSSPLEIGVKGDPESGLDQGATETRFHAPSRSDFRRPSDGWEYMTTLQHACGVEQRRASDVWREAVPGTM